MPELALTKTANPKDFQELAAELAIVDAVGIEGQHAMRRWEYAMALRALDLTTGPIPSHPRLPRFADVGGAGSHFDEMLARWVCASEQVVIDPAVNVGIEDYVREGDPFDAVFVISVLEHVDRWRAFLRACVKHLAPGGLLFLTVDYWDAEGPDTAHFHWMRERIYNRESIEDVIDLLKSLGCCRFGEADWTYHGHQVFDYTFCALAFLKKG